MRTLIPRAARAFLLLSTIPACFAKCEPITDWTPLLRLSAPEIIGFTYDAVSYYPGPTVQEKDGQYYVYVKTSVDGAKPIKLLAYQSGKIQADCLNGDLSDESKKLLGISAVRLATAAIMAATDLIGEDINGDGIGDSINTDDQSFVQPHGILVRFGNQSGGLANTPVRYASGKGATAVVLADFNGDGIRDAATANAGDFVQDSGSVSVLLGTASGTFSAPLNAVAGVSPVSLVATDLNGDGRMDLAVANQGSFGAPGIPANNGGVSVLIGKGDGTFLAATQWSTGNNPQAILAADFNKDQHLDLAVANRGSNTFSILPGKGDGSFQPAIHTAAGSEPSYFGAADFNGDGTLDLAVLQKNLAVIGVWIGSGNGTFQDIGRWMAGVAIDSFGIVQYAGETRPTIYTPDAAGSRLLYLQVNTDGTLVGGDAYEVGRTPSATAAADFNKDGKPDLAVAANNQVQLLLSGNGKRLTAPQTVAVPNSGGQVNAVAAGDFDRDGFVDLAVAGFNRVALLRGTGTGTFQTGGTLTSANATEKVLAIDLNSDGNLDLVTAGGSTSPAGNLTVFLGTNSGSFQSATPLAAGNRTVNLAAGNFNGDGVLDLVAVNSGDLGNNAGGFSLFLSQPGGGWAPAVNLTAAFNPNSAAVADFNGDGRMDLAYTGLITKPPTYRFSLGILPGNGNGTFQNPIEIPVDDLPANLAAADFNRDGRMDVMIAHCCGETDLTQLLGSGDFSFKSSTFPGGASPLALTVADFNGDARPDLAISNQGVSGPSGVITILTNHMDPAVHTNAATLEPGNVAPDSIVAAKGVHLATQTVASDTVDWPLSLGGTTVSVRDRTGASYPARVQYISPTQVNYVVPPQVVRGIATVFIKAGDGTETTATVGVENAAPGLFVVNSDGALAAYLARVNGSGTSYEGLVGVENGAVVSVPIDLGPESDEIILVTVGTGIRGATSLSNVQVTIGGIPVEVLYAGTQATYPGLDQVNVRLPKSLRGRGVVDVIITVDGHASNVARLRFK